MTGFIFISFILGLLLLAHFAEDNDDDWTNSKAYKDLNETMLNRNEDV